MTDDLGRLLERPDHPWVGRRAYLTRAVSFPGGWSYAAGVVVEVIGGFEGGYTLAIQTPDEAEWIVLADALEVMP